MAKLDLKNTVFEGRLDTVLRGTVVVVFPKETKERLGLRGIHNAYFKKFPGGCSRGDTIGVKLERDAFDYRVVKIVSVNGKPVAKPDENNQLPDAPTP